MKQFFANMNLARAIILLSVVGSLVLGYMGWRNQSRLREQEESLAVEIPRMVQEIQKAAELHTKLSRDIEGDEFVRLDNPESYVRKLATKAATQLGEVTVAPTKDYPKKGMVDFRYRVRPDDRERKYSRTQIANFLYFLEAESRRVKVTDVRIDLVDRKVKPHEIPADQWTFDIEFRSRQKLEDEG